MTTTSKSSSDRPSSLKRGLFVRLANLPVVSWLTRIIFRGFLRFNRRPLSSLPEDVGPIITYSTLEQIVRDIVDTLDYAGAMLATYEMGDVLPVRALYVKPQIATMDEITRWQDEISRIVGAPLSLTDPAIAKVYRYKDEYSENLSIRAAQQGVPVLSHELFDLFTPIIPANTRLLVRGVQDLLGIKQVIAVPFFINGELVGNLFAAKQGEITENDQRLLETFARQASALMQVEHYYQQTHVFQELVRVIQANLQDEALILEHIVEGIVNDFGYVAAIVSTHEIDGSIPVRAFYLHPAIASQGDISAWEKQVSNLVGRQVSVTDPKTARVFRYDKKYEHNLSIQAAEKGEPVITNELFDLFTPIIPLSAMSIIKGIQDALDIKQVIAVPFFINNELVGNLIAATRSMQFTEREIQLLKEFAQQAAIGIRNARLYQKSDERRQTAQIFARMAFSSAASVHTLRNHIGFVRGQLGAVQMLDKIPPSQAQAMLPEIVKLTPSIIKHLDQASNLLDTLHEPWKHQSETLAEISSCLERAIDKAIPSTQRIERSDINASQTIVDDPDSLKVEVHTELEHDLPAISTSADMLTEAFKVILKNAFEAIRERDVLRGEIWIRGNVQNGVVFLEIRDSGMGIKPENTSSIFDLQWTSKKTGMGFGLFWTKDFVEGLGGQIKLESKWGEGTSFTITLPLATAIQN